MEERERIQKTLQKVNPTLRECLKLDVSFLKDLVAKHVLTDEEIQWVDGIPGNESRVDYMFDILRKSRLTSYSSFLEVLEKHDKDLHSECIRATEDSTGHRPKMEEHHQHRGMPPSLPGGGIFHQRMPLNDFHNFMPKPPHQASSSCAMRSERSPMGSTPTSYLPGSHDNIQQLQNTRTPTTWAYPSYPPTGFISSNPMQTAPPPAQMQTSGDMPTVPVPVKLEAAEQSNHLASLTAVTTAENTLMDTHSFSRDPLRGYQNQPVSDPRFVYPTNTTTSSMPFPATTSLPMNVLSPTIDSSRYLPITPGPFPLTSPDLFGTSSAPPVTLSSTPYLPSSPPYQLYPHLYMTSPTTQQSYFDSSSSLPMLPSSSTRHDNKSQLKEEQAKTSEIPTDTSSHHLSHIQPHELAPMPYSTQNDPTRTLDLPMSMGGHVGNGGSPAPSHHAMMQGVNPHAIATSMGPLMPVDDDIRKEDVWRPY